MSQIWTPAGIITINEAIDIERLRIRYAFLDVDDVIVNTDDLRGPIRDEFLPAYASVAEVAILPRGLEFLVNPSLAYNFFNDIAGWARRIAGNYFIEDTANRLSAYIRELEFRHVDGAYDTVDYFRRNILGVGIITRGKRSRQDYKLSRLELIDMLTGPNFYTGDTTKIAKVNGRAAFYHYNKEAFFPIAVEIAKGKIMSSDENIEFNPSQILYVDDRLEHVIAARMQGMTAVWLHKGKTDMYKELDSVKEELKPFLPQYIINNMNQLNPMRN